MHTNYRTGKLIKERDDTMGKLLDIFWVFLKIGSFTFGGGYAMIPLIEEEIVNKKKWVTSNEIIDLFAIAESIPGAIAINTATFIGYKISGRKGAIAANIGVILPSLTIITLIASVFSKFQNDPNVQAALLGIRSCVVALILMAAVSVGKKAIKDKITFLVAILAMVSIAFLDIHPIFAIISGAVIGLVIMKILPDKVEEVMNAEVSNKGDEK